MHEITALATSFKKQLRELLLETGALSVATAVLPVLYLTRIGAHYMNEGESIFEAEDPEVEPVIYGPNSAYPNITIVPIGWPFYKE